MIFSEVICTELAFQLTTTWCGKPFYVPVPATGKLYVTNAEISMYLGGLDSDIVFHFIGHVKPFS